LAQLRWLKERGCAIGQGFLISKPLLGDDVCRLLRQGSRLELSL
jgi:EAL domain-containing protein (putative c-di-GMP-specific phosphodiesterase class I)